MATTRKPRTVLYRRKREGKTDYKKRLQLLHARVPRIVIRMTNTEIVAQVVEFSMGGDKVVTGLTSRALKEYGWPYSTKNIPAAYLTGLLLGKMALKKGCSNAVLDTGFRSPAGKGKVYAFLKGTVDAGLKIPHNPDIFPSNDRLQGKHVVEYSKKNKGAQFTQYLKSNAQPERMADVVEQVKQKIQTKESKK